MQIPVSHGRLEALLKEPGGEVRGAAVVCHPHPLHGGTMHTKPVYRAAQALAEVGVRTLRFNFRGVGASTGTFDGGLGEQEDARAALEWLAERSPGLPLVAAGFSFGSLVALSVGAHDPRVRALVGLGTPLELYDFSVLAQTRSPVLVVQGEHDPFGSPAAVREALSPLGDHITVVEVPGADHFFEGRLEELKRAIREFFVEGPGAEALKGIDPSPGEPGSTEEGA